MTARCTTTRVAAAAVLATAILGFLPGCATDPSEGWSTAELHDPAIRTVAVPIANHSGFDRTVATELTEAVIKAIEARTSWVVVPEARAETILVLDATAVGLRQLSRSRATGLAGEVAVTLDVDFEWSRMDTGAVLAARRDFRSTGLFVPSAPASERVDLGRFDAVGRAATAIVDAMRRDW